MAKLGPGANQQTLQVLLLLPQHRFDLVVDAGCGTGRQTLALAKELDTIFHAVDSHRPFLKDLERLAAEAKIGERIEVDCMDTAWATRPTKALPEPVNLGTIKTK